MPSPGRVPLHPGGPRAARLPPGPADSPVLGILPQEQGEPKQVRGGRARRADGVESLFPRQPGPARLHLVSRPAPSAGAVDEDGLLPRPLPGVPRTKGLRPAGGRAASPGPGRGLRRVSHAAPGDHEHSPHSGDQPWHSPRRCARIGGGGPAGHTGSAGGHPSDRLPLGDHDRGGAAGLRARPERGLGLGCPHHECPPTGEGRRDSSPSVARGGRPRPSRRRGRPRIPGTRIPVPGPSRRRPPRLRRGPSHRTEQRVDPPVLRPPAGKPGAPRSRARGVPKGDRDRSLVLGLSRGAGSGVLSSRRLVRGHRGLPRGDGSTPNCPRRDRC